MLHRPISLGVFIYRLPQDDPRKNTALKLARLGFAKLVTSLRELPRGSILLDPSAETPLSPNDKDLALRRGLSLIDCSWREAVRIHGRVRGMSFERRRLPLLIAVNPTHFGKPYILSTVEAVAASLYILGFRDDALRVLSIYKWGPNFLTINEKYLARYAENDFSVEREILGVDDVNGALMRLVRVYGERD
ncbi:DUF367 family protein [Vulcanisaeta thermophila]|uniref:DUF367 family protein n=1 Tax=Vulcanisaeta thermophila TaxID=867917 RepID=UPI000ACB1698|nr:DUF367 family protein [Vulcanisaeta thermophila]